MIKKLCLNLLFFLTIPASSQQFGELKGRVTERDTSFGIPFANVTLQQSGHIIMAQTTDVDGYYHFKNVPAGTYVIKCDGIGLITYEFTGILIENKKNSIFHIKMKEAVVEMKEYVITTSKIRLNVDKTVEGSSYKRQDIMNTPSATTLGIVNVTAGCYSRDGVAGNFSGSRQGSTVYIDGVSVRSDATVYTPYDELETEEYSTIDENRFQQTTISPLSTFSADVDRASYSVIRRYLKEEMLPPKNSIRIEEMINYFDYDYPAPIGNDPFSINMEVSSCPWNTKHEIISIGVQTPELDPSLIPPSNLVMLIDVSGSMSADDKLPLVKTSLKLLVNQLRNEDKIAIVVYAGNAGLVLPATNGYENVKIINAIDKLEAGGSTAGGQGIKLAYQIAKENFIENGNNRIVLCTDGDFNVGVSSETELENLITAERDKGIFLTVLGYGTGNYKDNKMEILADKGNGNYSYIDSQLEAEKVLVKEMVGTMFAIAKDVKFQVEFNPGVVSSYRLVGYENRVLENWEFNDDKRDAGEIGHGHTVTVLYEVELKNNSPIQSQDSLKYQASVSKPQFANEMLTLKIRYKPREKTESVLIETVLEKKFTEFSNASENHRFACSVAEFGMFLRDSEYKGTSSLTKIIEQAKACKKFDEEGLRAEFITLVKTVASLCEG